MLKQKNNLIILLVVAVFVCSALFFSCVSTPDESVTPSESITPVVSDEPSVAQTPEEPEEPVFTTVNFAQDLSTVLEEGTIDDALALFETIPEEYSDDFDLNFIYASLLFSAGKVTEASEQTDALLAQEPDNIDVLMLGTMIAKSNGDTTAKNALLKKILTRDPGNADANVELAEEQMIRKNYSQARKFYQNALATDSTHETALFGYGQVCYYLGLYNESKKAFNNLLKLNPEDGFAWAYLAKLDMENENYKVAIDYMEKAIQYEPDYYDFWIEYGSCLRYAGRFDDALKAWTKSIEINPDYFLGYVYRSGLYDETENFDSALEDYRMIVKLNPKYYYAYESLGMLAWYKGNWAESRSAFQKAYEASPSSSYVLMISATYLKENKTKENKEYLTKIMKTMDRTTIDYSMVRLYYEQNGDSGVVQKVVNEKNQTTRGKMLFYLALFYDLKGNDSLAQKYYIEVQTLQAPMFFEYRLNDWALEEA